MVIPKYFMLSTLCSGSPSITRDRHPGTLCFCVTSMHMFAFRFVQSQMVSGYTQLHMQCIDTFLDFDMALFQDCVWLRTL